MWSNAANWDCVVNGVSSHCVPGAGFTVTNIGGDITLDIDTSIKLLLGSGGSLTLNGKSLTATDPLGIQQTAGAVNLSNGAAVTGFLLTGNLQSQSSTVNGNVQALNANIANSTLGSLALNNQLTAINSSVGANSALNIVQPSTLTNSTIGGQFSINGGTLTLDSGSTVNATQSLIASGGLTIQGASTWNASTQPVFLGVGLGGASIDVTGTGSTLNLAGTPLELGLIGNSTVTVEHGGTVAATGAGGNLLIGLGVVFTNNSAMYVNSAGTVSANQITVSGSDAGSTALLSISDSPSSVTAADRLVVQNGGEVIAANQSSLTANSLVIDTGARVTIDSGATLTLASDTVALVGSTDIGFLTFQGGGTGTGPGQLVVGGSAGADGSVMITGLGSAWHGTNSVSIGEGGAGNLSVLNGGVFETGANDDGLSGSLGTQAGGSGTATIQGGDWQAGGTLKIGNAGVGSLTLSQAGTVESEGATLAVSLGSAAGAMVTGAGSRWTIAGDLTVGSGGNASLTIANGGLVSNQDATIAGLASSKNASVSVSGLGSRWVNSGKLTVGSNGIGSLFISSGGVVTNNDGTIGDKQGSNGAVTVLGLGSSWQNSGILTVGGDGGASLTIDTGSVTAGGAAIGSNFAPVQMTITNHGSLTVLGDLSIGGGGKTDVTIENGGTLDNENTATIGGSGGETNVTVTGAGSIWTIHGTGALTLDDQGSLFVMNGGTVSAATITLLPGSLLNGQGGNVIGSIVNSGGTVTAGDATGVLTITGNYSQTSGGLLFEIDGLGPTQFDQMVISGLANITGGTIDIVFGNGFVPAAGESFDLLSAALGLTLNGASFNVIGLPGGLQFFETIGANGFSLGFAPGSQTAPEPGAAVLVGIGLAVVVALRCRRALTKRVGVG